MRHGGVAAPHTIDPALRLREDLGFRWMGDADLEVLLGKLVEDFAWSPISEDEATSLITVQDLVDFFAEHWTSYSAVTTDLQYHDPDAAPRIVLRAFIQAMKTAIDIGRRSAILATAALASKETQWKVVRKPEPGRTVVFGRPGLTNVGLATDLSRG